MFQKGKKPPKSSDVAGSIISQATHLSIKLAKSSSCETVEAATFDTE
jgi:hypothetical protein